MKTCIYLILQPGWYVTIHITNVPKSFVGKYWKKNVIIYVLLSVPQMQRVSTTWVCELKDKDNNMVVDILVFCLFLFSIYITYKGFKKTVNIFKKQFTIKCVLLSSYAKCLNHSISLIESRWLWSKESSCYIWYASTWAKGMSVAVFFNHI